MIKRILIAALLSFFASISQAQFTDGQVLTAAELNNAFANVLALTGGTLSGPLTVPTLTVTGPLNASNASITGGTITGLSSPIPMASGGTNCGAASGACLDNITGFASTGYIKRTGAGAYSFVLPIPVSDGGTNATSASGTALDNITGFASTGFMSRTGAGAYSFTASTGSGSVVLGTSPSIATPTVTGSFTATGLVTTADLATQAANTVLANVTASTASPAAFAMPSCSTSASALNYTLGTGWSCNTAIAASTASTATTQAIGNNSTNIATTAFVAAEGPCVNILNYGGDNTNTSNNDTAWTNALAASTNSTTHACVYFPRGQYKFAAQIVFTFPASGAGSITIRGDGQENSILSWAAGGGMQLSYKTAFDQAHISGLTFTSGTTATGVGLGLIQSATSLAAAAVTTITDVAVRGSDGWGGTDYFSIGILSQGVSNIFMSNMNILGPGPAAGTGVEVTTNGSNIASIVYNISNSNINNWADGFVYGNQIQGVTISQCNFTNNLVGIIIPASETNLDQLTIMNSQLNNTQFNIIAQSAVPALMIEGNLFLIVNSTNGIQLNTTSNTVISGNQFLPNVGSPTAVTGITISGWTVGGTVITGNFYYNLTTGNSLGASSKNVNVQSNGYQANGTNNSNSGTGNVIGGGSP